MSGQFRMSVEDYEKRVAKQKAKTGAPIAEPKRAKYRNVKVTVDGIEFDSKREAARYMDLVLMQKAGEIKNLRRQVKYDIEVNGAHVCFYVADFVFERAEKVVVADAKGCRTPVFKLKAKLMLAVHGITIEEL